MTSGVMDARKESFSSASSMMLLMRALSITASVEVMAGGSSRTARAAGGEANSEAEAEEAGWATRRRNDKHRRPAASLHIDGSFNMKKVY